ncbi:MAG: 5'-methylthioadenosine/adenosylhomocysteine nucleosidase [Clostridia bacterium]|nr:5'-methylthioadenosine/adenosylhomocysteine nucleosidase [Clostridia bacterium]
MIGFLGAMDIEIEGLLKASTHTKENKISGITFFECKIENKDVIVAKCGIGKVNAALSAEAMILTYNPSLVINTGVAGSLSKTLKIGDIVLSEDVCQHDFDTSPLGDPIALLPGINMVKIPADKKALDSFLKASEKLGLNTGVGTIASGDQFVSSSEQKKFIVDTFNAKACEMEGGSIGQVCKQNGTPFFIIRALSDSADEGAVDDYPSFAKKAADNSVRLILEFLKN